MTYRVDGFNITQNAGDLIAGVQQGDLSRMSAYSVLRSDNQGLHTGASSPTIGRQNQTFTNFEGFRNLTDGKF